MANDIDDVVRQLAEVGLDAPPNLKVAFERFVRWRPSCERKHKKSAWIRLYEYRSTKSDRVFITGAFGWRGEQWEVRPADADWSPAERAAALEERKAAQREAEAQRKADAEAASDKARKLWARARPGDQGPLHPYLAKKKVGAFGVRVGYGNTLYIPMEDMAGNIHGLQYIDAECTSKKFGTGVMKEGRFHLIGEISKDLPIAFAEGYATGATVHMATGWPVVVCWDAGNLEPVVAQWRECYPEAKLVIMADDDRHLVGRVVEILLARYKVSTTAAEIRSMGEHSWEVPEQGLVTLKAGWGKDSNGISRIQGSIEAEGRPVYMLKVENAGRSKAVAVAKKHKAAVLFPAFTGDENPGTDWNDLACEIGLPAAREQLLKAFSEGGEPPKTRASSAPQGGGKKERKEVPQDFTFLERFTLIYGTTTVWDAKQRDIIRLESLKAAYGKTVDWWLGHAERKMVTHDKVMFDPTGAIDGSDEHVNLFDGLEMEPKPGNCELIKRHLYNLCGEDDRLYHWVICWLALPLQRPGTKMRTSLIMHGRMEGTGKSLMMDIMRRIYGRYSRSITQVQLQSEFNGWQSGMLFCVAEEVVSASERKNLKNLIQNMITNEVVQINEKNMPVREERSHANFVFLSNEQLPMLLNETDRRYTVIQVERVQTEDYFMALGEEVRNGGVEAFYDWLLHYDLEGFNEFTRPFETRARMHLITLGMAPDQRFVKFWSMGLAEVPFCTCTARDLYTAFRSWCRMNGERFIANNTQFGRTVSEALDRLQCPPKRQVRFDGYSAAQIDKGDFSSDNVTPSGQQGVVYFVKAEIQRIALDGTFPSEETKTEDCMVREVYEKRIKAFQYALSRLVDQARRAI